MDPSAGEQKDDECNVETISITDTPNETNNNVAAAAIAANHDDLEQPSNQVARVAANDDKSSSSIVKDKEELLKQIELQQKQIELLKKQLKSNGIDPAVIDHQDLSSGGKTRDDDGTVSVSESTKDSDESEARRSRSKARKRKKTRKKKSTSLSDDDEEEEVIVLQKASKQRKKGVQTRMQKQREAVAVAKMKKKKKNENAKPKVAKKSQKSKVKVATKKTKEKTKKKQPKVETVKQTKPEDMDTIDSSSLTSDQQATPTIGINRQKWMANYEALQKFYEEFGHCRVPLSHPSLGKWVNWQRTAYHRWQHPEKKALGMNQERVDLLNKLNFEWVVTTPAKREAGKRWKRINFRDPMNKAALDVAVDAYLKRKRKRDAKKDAPEDYDFDDENDDYDDNSLSPLPMFTNGLRIPRSTIQRHAKFRLEKEAAEAAGITIPDDKQERQRDMKLKKNWMAFYKRLQQFHAEMGHCRVPVSYPNLGKWVNWQRTAYHRMHEPTKPSLGMNQERVELLNKLNFEWSVAPTPVPWNIRFLQLKEFKKIHGHCNVPQHYKENPKLGMFVKLQRQQYKFFMKEKQAEEERIKNPDGNHPKRRTVSISQEQIDKLNGLGFSWDVIKPRKSKGETAEEPENPVNAEKESTIIAEKESTVNAEKDSTVNAEKENHVIAEHDMFMRFFS